MLVWVVGNVKRQFLSFSPCSQNFCLQWIWLLLLQWMAWQALPSGDLNSDSGLVKKGKERLVVLTQTFVGICPHNPHTQTPLCSWWASLGKSQNRNGEVLYGRCLGARSIVALLSSCLPLARNQSSVFDEQFISAFCAPCLNHIHQVHWQEKNGVGYMSCVYSATSVQWREGRATYMLSGEDVGEHMCGCIYKCVHVCTCDNITVILGG